MRIPESELNKAAVAGAAKVVEEPPKTVKKAPAKKKAKKKAAPKARAPKPTPPAPEQPVVQSSEAAQAMREAAGEMKANTAAVLAMADSVKTAMDARRAQPVKFTFQRDSNKLTKTVIAEPIGE